MAVIVIATGEVRQQRGTQACPSCRFRKTGLRSPYAEKPRNLGRCLVALGELPAQESGLRSLGSYERRSPNSISCV